MRRAARLQRFDSRDRYYSYRPSYHFFLASSVSAARNNQFASIYSFVVGTELSRNCRLDRIESTAEIAPAQRIPRNLRFDASSRSTHRNAHRNSNVRSQLLKITILQVPRNISFLLCRANSRILFPRSIHTLRPQRHR